MDAEDTNSITLIASILYNIIIKSRLDTSSDGLMEEERIVCVIE